MTETTKNGIRRKRSGDTPVAQYSVGNGEPTNCSQSDSEESETHAMRPNVSSPSMSALAEYRSTTTPQEVSDIPSLFISNISRADLSSQDGLLKVFGEFGKVGEAYFVKKQGPGEYECAVLNFDSWREAEATLKRYEEHLLKKERDWASVPAVRYARPRAGTQTNAISPRRLFIGQLPKSIREEQMREWFSQFGDIEEASMLYKNNQFAGCGFVQYSSWASCDAAISQTRGRVVFDSEKEQRSHVVVKYARSTKCYNRNNRSLHERQDWEATAFAGGWLYDPMSAHYCYGQMFPIPNDYIADQSYMPAASISSTISHYMPAIVRQAQESVDSRKIFIGQLPKEYTEEHLYALFAQFGNIEDVTLLRKGNESKCCGFVTYKLRMQALGAVEGANKARITVGTRPLVVRLARSRRR
eukprot:jgi/Picsp_1/1202/NSC_04683-R1_elav-like family member 4